MATFCGQVHGAGEFRALGVILQRALLICTLTCIPPLLLWWTGAERVLLTLGALTAASAPAYTQPLTTKQLPMC